MLEPGGFYLVDRRVSPQFMIPILVRYIRTKPITTWAGWAWIEAYEVNGSGDAVTHRELYVQPEKLELVPPEEVAQQAVALVERYAHLHELAARHSFEPTEGGYLGGYRPAQPEPRRRVARNGGPHGGRPRPIDRAAARAASRLV